MKLLTSIAGVAASARVGNLIGARSARGAKRAGHAAALLSVVVGTVVMISMMATKDVRTSTYVIASLLKSGVGVRISIQRRRGCSAPRREGHASRCIIPGTKPQLPGLTPSYPRIRWPMDLQAHAEGFFEDKASCIRIFVPVLTIM